MDAYASALGLDDTPAPLRANNPGALMPGGKLAQFSSPGEGLAALDANLQDYGKKGVSTLAGVISKWAPSNENNTQAYIADAAARLGIKPDQPIDLSDPVQRHAIGTAILLHENGPGAIFSGGRVPAPQPAPKSASSDPYSAALGLSGPAPAAAPAPAPGMVTTGPNSLVPGIQVRADPGRRTDMETEAGMGGALLHYGTGLAASVVGGLHGLGTLATGGSLDDAVRAIEDDQRRLTFNPKGDAGELVQAGSSRYSPLTYPAQAGGFVGNKVGEVTGSPLAATVADVGTQFLGPMAVGKGVQLARNAMKPAPPQARIEPTMEAIDAASDTAPAAASAVTAPRAGSQAAPAFSDASPDVPGGVSAAEQARRAAVLKQVGLAGDVRASAITGDAQAAATDFQSSRLDSPAGRAMRGKIDAEKQALTNFSDNIAQQTGGSTLNDQAAKMARGETILAPMESMQDWYDSRIRGLYQVADERAQGVPTQLDGFRSVLGDDSLATNSDRVQLRQAIGAYAKKLGIVDDQGNVFANGQQAETMRKYLNENWSPATSGLIGKLKDALDDDVMSAAGEDVYSAARQMRAQKAQALENPNGIAKLLDTSGPNGINRKVPAEKVADTLTNLPVAQLQHITDTLKAAPDEIQPQAQAALAEIKAQFAHNVREIGGKYQGQWNAKGVQAYLRANSARMQAVFSPEELEQFSTLNDAGNILAKDQSYPGAAVQGHNLIRSGVMGAIQHGATTAGAAIAGPVGAVAGNMMGARLAGKVEQAAELRAVQKRFKNLSDLLPRQDQ